MSSAVSVAPRPWPRRRFWTAIALVFGLQVALLFWLSDRSPAVQRRPAATPVFRLSHIRPGELMPLKDPTLFALPHEPGLSGLGWRRGPAPDLRAEHWSEPPRWLLLAEGQLGAEFAGFTRTNAPPAFPTAVMPRPAMTIPDLPPVTPVVMASTLRLEGGLKQRRLLVQPELRSWRNADLLTNSVVLVLVNARGITDSWMLAHSSGLPEADQLALRVARSARFESIEATGPGRLKSAAPDSTPGTMIFEWQTLPSTNGPPEAPAP